MKQWILSGVSAAALVASTGAGWSLTAQQAWENWKTAAESYGQTLTSESEATMDGTLTVKGVGVSSDIEDMNVTATVDQVEFAEQGDGSVVITMSENVPVVVSGTSTDGEKVDVTISVTQTGMSMTATDADGGTAFTYDAPKFSVGVDELKVDDADFPMTLMADMMDVSGTYSISAEPENAVDSKFNAASMTFDMDVKDPEGSGTMTFALSMSDIASWTKGQSMGMGADGMDDMAKMLADGFTSSGGGTYGATTFKMDFEEDGSTVQAEGGLSDGHATFALSKDGMDYDVAYNGLDVVVSGSEIPLPQVAVSASSVATKFAMPVSVDQVSPFEMRFALEGLSVGEEIWSMIDPGAVLPRDPATMIFDVAGTGQWSVDIFDEEAMMASEMPGTVDSLDINEVKVAIGGAELTGDGAFTLDNTDLETFDGMPRPEGSVNLRLVGGNGLLENLTKMGLVPEDQVMMVRMMTGMFAKPGAGPDELLSEIKVDGSGKLLINGAPMPF